MTTKNSITPEQAQVLEELEKLIGKPIPKVEKLSYYTFEVKIEDYNVVGLSLYDQGLSALPESITRLKSLRILSLSGNKFTTFPESITRLKSLQKLCLDNNKLITLPESIGNLSSIQTIQLLYNELSTLPESIGNLTSLEMLDLGYNKLTTLPESIGNLSSLKDLRLFENQLTTLPESIGNLSSLEILDLDWEKITYFPESMSNLKVPEELRLNGKNLSTLPESIGNLTSLEFLGLHDNKLIILPESIGNLTSLKWLYLYKNQLTSLPNSLWKLKNLEVLSLSNNPWEGEWKGIEKETVPRVLELCRQKNSIIVFISYSEGDKKHFHVSKFKENLKKQEEIREVYSSGEKNISESQLFLFIATQNSIKNEKCRQELELALAHYIPVIPIKGIDITFEELSQIDLGADFKLSDKLGFEFDGENVEKFCDKLYEHIKKYKREVNLFESEERKIDERWRNLKIISEKYVTSEEFKEDFQKNTEHFKKLNDELKNNRISPFEYIFKTGQIFRSKSK